jgi:hypothetical protein
MARNSVVSFPTPLYANVPINANFYIPNQFFISDISQGIQTIVTTTVNHNYVIGQLVRLIIPKENGIRGLNETESYVIDIPSLNQVTLAISSIGMDPFITSTQPTQPQILAIGNVNSGNINSSGRVNTGTFIPGSFINISPL